MNALTFESIRGIKGTFTPPPDKSITHRALILSAMAEGISGIRNALMSLDTEATVSVLKALGASFSREGDVLRVESPGYRGFTQPEGVLWCANSGTTARMISGVLAPGIISATVDGDASLRRRPMERVISPLRSMGADLASASGDGRLPVIIKPSQMFPADIKGDTPSAQVKSAVLLAGAQLEGVTSYTEKLYTRDHTERLLSLFGGKVEAEGLTVRVNGGTKLAPAEIEVPGDLSSAAVMIACALMYENSELTALSVGINPTRRAFLDILLSWGAQIKVENFRNITEPVADLTVRGSSLQGGIISGNLAQYAIDELPLLGMLGLFTREGVAIRNATELRFKECDRIAAMVENLRALGAEVEERDDGFSVAPLAGRPEAGVTLDSKNDHRIAMINVLLAKRWGLNILSSDLSGIGVSYPDFLKQFSELEIL